MGAVVLSWWPECRLARYSHPPPCCYPRSRGNCAPLAPFLVQARSTPVASHTFTRIIYTFIIIQLSWIFSLLPKRFLMKISPHFSHCFPPTSLFLGKWLLRRKWFNRRRMPLMSGPLGYYGNPRHHFHSFTTSHLTLLLSWSIRKLCIERPHGLAMNINQPNSKKTLPLHLSWVFSLGWSDWSVIAAFDAHDRVTSHPTDWSC